MSGDPELVDSGSRGRLMLRGAEVRTDYSYRVVARLGERRSGPGADESPLGLLPKSSRPLRLGDYVAGDRSGHEKADLR